MTNECGPNAAQRAWRAAPGTWGNELHRWYEPTNGRWLSEDPIGFAAGDANLYRYVGNGVTNATDPSGLHEYRIDTAAPASAYDIVALANDSSYYTWAPKPGPAVALKTAAAIKAGRLKGLVHAPAFLEYYAANKGGVKSADVHALIREDTDAKSVFGLSLRDAQLFVQRHSMKILRANNGRTIVTTTEYYTSAVDQDWHLTLKDYAYWVKASDIHWRNGRFHMDFEFNVRDVYDFDLNSNSGVGSLFGLTPYILTDRELAEMHRFGDMRAFEVNGTARFHVSWKCGDEYDSRSITPIP